MKMTNTQAKVKSKMLNPISRNPLVGAGIALATTMSSLWALPAYAQFTLTDGDFEYEQRGDDLGASDINVNGGNDNLFQDWWFFRVDGDTSESVFQSDKTPTSSTVNTALLDFASNGVFSASLDYTLTDLGGGEGAVLQNMSILNETASDLVIDLFYYVDLDVDASFSNTATLAGPNSVLFEENGVEFTVIGSDADAFQVLEFSDLLDLLEDGAITNLDNSGVPFGPGDATVAFQWSLLIPAGESTTVSGAVGIGDFSEEDVIPTPVAEPVPEPGSSTLALALLALSGMGLRVLRR
ncbi:hypothetical protein [Crocosphaera sp.]|uniref:hypothetical protein n=1 Tax=Crocosphaera sp. TaxID=2729996 RepID=UPI00260E04DF|nr:hypothetical protein [Crocosphaera sp.]MDJ0581436.1 hypothetical protein [Crocosphaera sp.]